MFAVQQYRESTPERKRPWQDEDAIGFSEHRNKRHHRLPLRSSQSADPIIPLDSNTDQFIRKTLHPDTDLSPLGFGATSQTGKSSLSVPPREPNEHHATSRIPTPIQPSFAAQVRGQQCGAGNMSHHHDGFSYDRSMPRTVSQSADWQEFHNNRRLPSPISEGEGMETPDMIVDSADDATSSQLSARLRASSITNDAPHPFHEMEHPNAMDFEGGSPSPTHVHYHTDTEAEQNPESPSPTRKSHMRNKHTINNWTWQPGMKRSFSMGYRADCEKCRAKVPGHFNHIIIS